jgi:hypothetical protein
MRPHQLETKIVILLTITFGYRLRVNELKKVTS